jgi:hypothetical protein
MPERVRSERRIEEVTHGAGNYGGSRDNAGAVALATNAGPRMDDQSGKSGPQRPDTVARATEIHPQATATALAALQAWFLLPLRTLQSWQEAWFRLLPR